MVDRERVIAELKAYINYPEPLCSIVKDALELLEEQKSVDPCSDCQEFVCDGCKYADVGEVE